MINTLFIFGSIITTAVYSQTIVDLASSRSDLSTLVGALQATGLDSALSGAGPFTVFAPTDTAFSAITVPTDTNELAKVLQYHVVSGTVLSTDLFSGLVAETLISQTITVQIGSGVSIYDSNGRVSTVTEADINATNGVIHIIDTVLLPDGTIANIASNIADLSSVYGAVVSAGLAGALADESANLTLFAPTNAAVGLFTGTIDAEVLLYHVLGDEYLSGNIPDGSTALPSINTDGDQVTVIKDDTGVFVQDAVGRLAQVTMANIAGINGVVHIIDLVLAPEEYRTVVDLAVSNPDLSTLVSALTDAGLVSILSGDGPFTVFAPTDAAFAAITVPTDTNELAKVLQYHVVSGTVLSTDLFSGLVAETLISQTITVQIGSGVSIYDSNGRASTVTEADITGTNGVIHIIDTVLLPDGTVADIASNIDSLSTLYDAVGSANLAGALADETATLTLFAPTNDAISMFTGDIDAEVLLYHVLGTEYESDDIPDGSNVLTSINIDGDELTIIKNDTGVFVQDAVERVAMVTIANIAGINGVVHIIDLVLAPMEYRTVVDFAIANPDLSTLVSALTTAGLVDALSGDGPFTVFAPTDAAFAAIEVPTDVTVLSKILQYHVLSGQVLSTDLSSGLVAPTLINQTITVQIDSGVFIYDSNGRTSQVTEADITASNGVIHIIDTVILPDGTLADITANVDILSSLDGALVANELDTVLADSSASFTLFAPSNDAVAAFTGTIDSELLLYHVIGTEYLSGDIPDGETELTTANTDGDEVTVIKNATGVFVKDAADRVGQVTMANIAGVNGVAHIIDIVLSPDDDIDDVSTTPSPVMDTTDVMSGANKLSISIFFSFYFLALFGIFV